MSFRRGNLGFFCLEGFFWASYCTLFGYTVTILRQYGYSADLCGLVTTLQCVVFMLVQPAYGYLVDHVVSKKKAVVAVMTVGALFVLLAPLVFAMGTGAVVLFFTVDALFIFSGGAIVDAWAVSVINKTRGMDFALVRGGGSVFYAITALGVGGLLATFGVQILFTMHLVLGLAAALVACFLVDDTKLEPAPGHPLPHRGERVTFLQSAKVLLRNPAYLRFTACVALYNFGMRPVGTYLSLVLENAGGDSSHFGLSLFLAAGGEIIFMLLASRLILRGMPHVYVFLGAMLILTTRLLLLGITDNLWVIVLSQCITALGVGFNLRVNAEYLVSLAPEGYQGMAIMLSGAISNGIGCVLGNYLGGQLIVLWGIKPYLLLCTGMMAAAALLFLPTVLAEHRNRRALHNQFLLHHHKAASEEEREG